MRFNFLARICLSVVIRSDSVSNKGNPWKFNSSGDERVTSPYDYTYIILQNSCVMKILKPSYVKLLYQIGVILTQHQILVNDLQGNV